MVLHKHNDKGTSIISMKNEKYKIKLTKLIYDKINEIILLIYLIYSTFVQSIISKYFTLKKIILFLVTIFFSTLVMAQKATDNFSGNWITDDGTIIEITKSDNSFIGIPTGTNLKVLYNLSFTNGKWIGKIFDPRINITANCEATLEDTKIKFVAKKGFITKEIIWTKKK